MKNDSVGRAIKANMSSMIGEVDFNGKKHWSIPAVMMLPGVRNKVLYTEDALSKFPETWNGMPVTVDHPLKDNKITDANQPDVLESFQVGQMFGCTWDQGKLKGFCYVDPDLLAKKNQKIFDRIKANGILEVSTGMFTDDEIAAGEWSGEAYEIIAKTVYPNHFALLSNGVGACSVADGAGAPRINQQQQEKPNMLDRLKEMWKSLGKELNFKVNELSQNDTRARICAAVKAEYPSDGDTYAWVQDIFDRYFIYEVSKAGETAKLFKRGYAVNSKDEVSLLDDKEEVVLKTEYVPAPKTNQEQQPEGEKTMETPAVTTPATTAVQTPAAATPKVLSEQEVQTMIQTGIEAGIKANRKNELVAGIKANAANTLPDSALNAMSTEELLKHCKDLIPANFGGLPPPALKDNEETAIPEPPPCFLAPVTK